MSYKEFFIEKKSGTYSEMLEAYGLAKLLEKIIGTDAIINIKNIGLGYKVTSNEEIMEEKLNQLQYFQIIKFIKANDSKEGKSVPMPNAAMGNYFDYPNQKAEKDKIKAQREEIKKDKKLNAEQKKEKNKEINVRILSEFGNKIDSQYDVYSEIVLNSYEAFLKNYNNFDSNQTGFNTLIKEILNHYSDGEKSSRNFRIEEKIKSLQMFSPSQGKGLNRIKADGLSTGNKDGFWIVETMKILGGLNSMICQYIKVGSTYDLKIFVPDFNNITLSKSDKIINEFKKHLQSSSPIKLDVLNILNFTKTFILNSVGYQKKVKYSIAGFHSVYQKSLGKKRAVINIAFIETPDFVDCSSRINGEKWVEILNEQVGIIQGIKEQGDATQGLLAYRSFLSASNLNSFFKFTNWYSIYLMQALDNQKYYVKPFQIETLNIFYNMVDKNENLKLGNIITNEGFLAVAKAIRNSTVILQTLTKDRRKFEIRYGLSQDIQNKSKSKSDLTIFIGEFVTTYNAETAKRTENLLKNNNKDEKIRAFVKKEELSEFYQLLDGDNHSSRLIGALLSSYGFAKTKQQSKEKIDTLRELADELGYELTKIGSNDRDDTETEETDDDNI